MEKIDKRRHYVIMLDTETANTLTSADGQLDMGNVLIYDIGWAVIDTKGNVYETRSFVNKDIFVHELDLMRSAYYAKKLPQYFRDIQAGRRIPATLFEIRAQLMQDIEDYGISEVGAHNARFDANAVNITQRYVTKSKYRYFFPFDSIEWFDTMKMAKQVVLTMPTYQQFCEKHGYFTKGQHPRPRLTAEILYQFITGNVEFEEEHTALADVLIECEIFWYCLRRHKAMDKRLYPNRAELPPATEFQLEILRNMKENPVIRVGY